LCRDDRRRLADKRWVGEPLWRDQHLANRVHLRFREKIGVLRQELTLDVLDDRLVDNDGVLRRAEQTVVERLPRDDVADGLLHIRGPLDERGRVTGTDAVGGLARTVRRPHQPHASSCKNHRHIAVLHQFLRALECDRRHPVDGARRTARAARGLIHHLGDPGDASHRGGVWAQHHRTSSLDRDEDLVDRG
jgi:hypothetical protein